MRIYLDDDGASPLLARLLRQAGHDVVLPASVGLAGRSDQVHLAYAIRDGRGLLTKNYGDFEELDELIIVAQGHHPGIFVVRQDNDPTRDLKPAGIVRAIGNLLAAGVPIPDNYHILNHWR
jgi:predicted nuclease of predicted toxin-antitoxin system